MKTITILLLLLFFQTKIEFIGKPTTEKINAYIKENEYQFIVDYQNFIGDTLNDVYIVSDDLSTYYNHNELELGYFYFPNEIIITNEELFLEYRLKNLSKFKKNIYGRSNQFVYAVVMHELTHFYFQQIITEAKANNIAIDRAYTSTLRLYPYSQYGAEFIEEGLCEYIPIKMGEIIASENYQPTVKEIVDNQNDYSIKYGYSSQYISSFVDSLGLKETILLLIRNQPPSLAEICDKDKFLRRLKYLQ